MGKGPARQVLRRLRGGGGVHARKVGHEVVSKGADRVNGCLRERVKQMVLLSWAQHISYHICARNDASGGGPRRRGVVEKRRRFTRKGGMDVWEGMCGIIGDGEKI